MQRQDFTSEQIQALTDATYEAAAQFAEAAHRIVRLLTPTIRALHKAICRTDPQWAAKQRARERSRRNSRNPRPKPRRRH